MSTFTESLWSATAPPAPSCPALTGSHDADVVVVGAGYTGLSAALHLAREGKNVFVLEAGEPGFGCSGRNGGQVNPGSTKMLPSEIFKTLGRERGEKFLQFGDRSCDIVFELIEQYGIECEAVRPGYVQGGYGERGRRMNEGWAKGWEERGVNIDLLDQDGVNELIGSRGYEWGLLDSRGGNVQPLAYARGLAQAALSEGATVCGGSKVLSITREGAGWNVTTASGRVNCANVVLATNGYTDDLWPGLRESVVPTTSFVTATKPMGHNLAKTVLPGRHAVSETSRIIVYYRLDESGRFIIGGRGNWLNSQERGLHDHVRASAIRLFPQLADIEWEYDWGGWPAVTKNHTPHLFKLDDGVYAGMGYNGRGVGSATLMGQQLALVILGSGEPFIAPRPLERFAFHSFRQIGISFHMLTRTALDKASAWMN
jgi:glycine/D-amino acid oxidase-like deaminating enzyme